MSRNLDRRVEAMVRITDAAVSGRLLEVLDVSLSDDRLAWTLDGDGVWSLCDGQIDIDAHVRLQQLAAARAAT
jgi:polyphosphate kinase